MHFATVFFDYSFCHINDPIQHLLFDCAYANSCGELFTYCLVVQDQLTYMTYLIVGVNWRVGSKHTLPLLTAAAAALCWTNRVTRNEVVFDRCRPKTLLQVLFSGTHWLWQWAQLQRNEDQEAKRCS
jgi:hypothetical protein